ncbi:MAG: hypothetical protein ACE15F_17750 [bacterium]
MIRKSCLAWLVACAAAGAQTISDNRLPNPGAEEGLDGWVILSGTVFHSSAYQYQGYNSFALYENAKIEQKVDVSDYAEAIGAHAAQTFLGAVINCQDENGQGGFGLRFIDHLGFEIGKWQQADFASFNEWKEIQAIVDIPQGTRTIAFQLVNAAANGRVFFDEAFLRMMIYEPTPTPTVTPTPTLVQPTPTLAAPSPTPGGALSPFVVYSFNQPTASENGLLFFPPGAPGDFDLGDVYFRPLNFATGYNRYSDGFGITVTLDGGEGATFYGRPAACGEDYVFMRISVSLNAPGAVLAFGALDAVEAPDLAGANLNGSIESNLLMDASRFLNRFDTLEVFYRPERSAIVPVFQVVNPPQGEKVTAQFDNLEIYRIPKNQFVIPPQ